jgi:predicted GTPase
LNVRLYDSEGLEYDYDQFRINTVSFLKEIEVNFYFIKGQKSNKHVHIVWIILDGSTSRIDGFYKELSHTILKKYKVLFVINKGDTVEKETIDKIVSLIEKENIENCSGIFTTMANSNNFSPSLDKCPKCNGENIASHVKDKELICIDCNWKEKW